MCCVPERLIFEIKKKTRNIEGKGSTTYLAEKTAVTIDDDAFVIVRCV